MSAWGTFQPHKRLPMRVRFFPFPGGRGRSTTVALVSFLNGQPRLRKTYRVTNPNSRHVAEPIWVLLTERLQND